MPMRIGKPVDGLTEYAIVGQDGPKINDFKTMARTIEKTLQSYSFPNKASIKYDFDFMTEAEWRSLILMLRNRSAIHEGLLTLPEPYSEYSSKCILDFNAITNPSSTHIAAYADTATAPAPSGGWAELTTAQYGKLWAYDSNELSITPAVQGQLMLAFKISDFLAQFSYEEINRLTLILFGMKASPLKFYAYNFIEAAWYEIKRATYLDDTQFSIPGFYRNYQNVAALHLPWGCTDFLNYFLSSSRVCFLITFPAGADIYLQYAKLAVNGYHVINASEEDFNFRESFIGAGRKGSIELQEI